MTATRRQQIADVVRAARTFNDMTQAQLAEAVGVHAQTIGNLERALVDTSPDLLRSLERVLHIDLAPAALTAFASAELVRSELVRRFGDLGDADAVILAGETLRFIIDWTRTEEPRSLDHERGRRSHNGTTAGHR